MCLVKEALACRELKCLLVWKRLSLKKPGACVTCLLEVIFYQPQELQLCFSLIEEKIVLKIYLHPSSGRLEPSWGVSQRACFGVTDW